MNKIDGIVEAIKDINRHIEDLPSNSCTARESAYQDRTRLIEELVGAKEPKDE